MRSREKLSSLVSLTMFQEFSCLMSIPAGSSAGWSTVEASPGRAPVSLRRQRPVWLEMADGTWGDSSPCVIRCTWDERKMQFLRPSHSDLQTHLFTAQPLWAVSTAQRLLLVSCDCLHPRVSLSEPLFDRVPSEISSAPHPPEKQVLPRPYPRVLSFPPVSVEASDREPSSTGDLLVINNCASESCYGSRQGRKETQAEVPAAAAGVRVIKKDCTSPRSPWVAVELGSIGGLGLGLQKLSVHRAGEIPGKGSW